MKKWLYFPVAATLALYLATNSGDVAQNAYNTVAGGWLAPYQYRILFAHSYVAFARMVGNDLAMWGFYFIVFALFGGLMHEWFGYWTTNDRAVTWSLYALTLSAGFAWFQPSGTPWSLLEVIFWLVALILLKKRQEVWLAPLIFVATLNRETTVFLVFLVLVVTRRWKLCVLLGIVWAVTYGAIRLYYGSVPLHVTIADIWELNTSTYRFWHFLFGLMLFGWLPVLSIRGYRRAKVFLRRAAWVAPPYLVTIAVFGVWREFRLFIPLLPVAIPLVFGLPDEDSQEQVSHVHVND